jgi:hypothetical protein
MIDARGGMIKQLAKDFYNKLYSMPPGPTDLEEFAELVLNEFIKELENNRTTVAWNYGCDSVVFWNKDLEKKSIVTIKEAFCGNKHDKSDTTECDGERDTGDRERDQASDILHEQKESIEYESDQRSEDGEVDSP